MFLEILLIGYSYSDSETGSSNGKKLLFYWRKFYTGADFYTGAVFVMLGKMRRGNFFVEGISTLNLFSGWGGGLTRSRFFLRRLRGRIQPKLPLSVISETVSCFGARKFHYLLKLFATEN